MDQGVETWYAVHVMYYVQPSVTFSLPQSIINNGCMVFSVAQGTPGNLGWTAAQQPSWCTGATFPTGSATVPYSTFTALANGSPEPPDEACSSWGNPAIMVRPGTGGAPTAYLAASCFDASFTSLGYYIFSTTDLTLGTGWTYYAGPFTMDDLLSVPGLPTYSPTPNSLNEFDWAERADGTLVAGLCTPFEASRLAS